MRTRPGAQQARLWPGLAIVGEAYNGCEANELVAAKRPDIVFLDAHMPGVDGGASTRDSPLPALTPE